MFALETEACHNNTFHAITAIRASEDSRYYLRQKSSAQTFVEDTLRRAATTCRHDVTLRCKETQPMEARVTPATRTDAYNAAVELATGAWLHAKQQKSQSA